jgi:hypothetical protein
MRSLTINLSWRARLSLAVASALLLWPLGFFLDAVDPVGFGSDWLLAFGLVGGLFGVLVLVPFMRGKAWWQARVIGLVLGSIFIYQLVVELAVEQYGPLDLGSDYAIVVSGVLGALLVGVLTQTLAPFRAPVRLWIYLAVAGAVGGFVFGLLWESSNDLVIAAGYAAWQVPVFFALERGRR